MKILQVYSNESLFKSVKFNEGFNVVIGKVTQRKRKDLDTHNLGKTTLLHLIDFLLLKKVSGDFFLKKHSAVFGEYVFFLELLLNDGRCLTIRRSAGNSSKVSFKLHVNKYEDFRDTVVWDYENLPLTSKVASKNPRFILNDLLGFTVLSDFYFRNTFNYFFRTQSDYDDVFKLSKFIGKHETWKPQLFTMLGFDSSLLVERYSLAGESDELTGSIRGIESKFQIDHRQVDKLTAMLAEKVKDKDDLQAIVAKFSFSMEEAKINRELVDEVEASIASLNIKLYKTDYEVKQLKESLRNNIEFDITEAQSLFEEVGLYFPENLVKSFEELMNFNKAIFTERKKYIIEQIAKDEYVLKQLVEELDELDTYRSSLLAELSETDTFAKFKALQSRLIRLEVEINDINHKIENVDVVKGLKSHLREIDSKIDDLSIKISEQIEMGCETYRQIRFAFSLFVRSIIQQTAALWMSVNSHGNVDFHAEIIGVDDVVSSKGDGYTYKKILCVCFDLAIVTTYVRDSFYRSIYHDGVLESLDNRKKGNYIELVKNICVKYGVQYILTMIEDDTPVVDDIPFLSSDDIVLTLDDRPDDSGRLFGFDF